MKVVRLIQYRCTRAVKRIKRLRGVPPAPELRRPRFPVDHSLEQRRAEKAAELEARGVRPRLGRPGGGDAA